MNSDEIDAEAQLISYMQQLLHIDSETSGLSATDAEYCACKMRDFIDGIPGGVFIYRADGDEQIVYANTALIRIFDCADYREFIKHTGGTFRGIVHPDDYERVESEIERQIKSNNDNLDYVEYRIVRKDGIVRWVEDFGHYVSSGDSNFFYVFVTDATEKIVRRMTETATLLSQQREKDQTIQNLIEEYDKERSLIRQEHLRRLEVIEGLSVNYDSILYADIDLNQILPYRLSERLKKQFTDRLEVRELRWFLNNYVKVWVHPDDREYVRKVISVDYIKSTLATTNTYYVNYRCVYLDEVQYIQIRFVNVSENGVSQVVIGCRNVDEEVRHEMERQEVLQTALEKAKLADIAKNTFLSNMSHDMRTPLNAIFGYTSLAKKWIADLEKTMLYLDNIEKAANQILELVEKVLEVAYTESERLMLDLSETFMTEAIQTVYDSFTASALKKNLKFRLHMSAFNHDYVIADKAKLQKLLQYVVSNAIKYTKEGSVDFYAEEVPSKSSDYATFQFTVKDTGIGITKEALPRIFNAFERESNSTESGVFGSGLGLTIAKQFAEVMGGNITVESEPNKGSTFVITVSLRIKSQNKTERADHSDLIGKKILVVEDNEINLEIETEILQEHGFTVFSAENGQVAVDKIKAASAGDYDIVLMDIQMPVMDGRTAARLIRSSDCPLSSIPIIALSANAFESDRRESIDAGMNDHLTKPIDVEVLIKTIRQTLCQSE